MKTIRRNCSKNAEREKVFDLARDIRKPEVRDTECQHDVFCGICSEYRLEIRPHFAKFLVKIIVVGSRR